MRNKHLRNKLTVVIFVLIILLLEILYLGRKTLGKEGVSQFSTDSCTKYSENYKKSECYENILSETLRSQGLDKSFELIDKLYNSDSYFASDCHGYAHKLGEATYRLFLEKEDFSLSEKASYCGYGFYHGFMEILLKAGKDINLAREFCELADRKLSEKTTDAGGACYHGIGHGTVDGGDPQSWGDPNKMIAPGIDLCEYVSDNEERLFRCTTGVFNALEIYFSRGQYNLSLNKEDPFWICRNQPERYKRSCYTQMVVAAFNVAGGDFEKSSEFINTIVEDKYATEAMAGLVVERVRVGKTSHRDTVIFCRNLPSRFHEVCITAFGEGFMKYGPPGLEHVKAIEFCHSSYLSEQEKKVCFERVLSLLRIWNTVDEAKRICESVDTKYQWRNCTYY